MLSSVTQVQARPGLPAGGTGWLHGGVNEVSVSFCPGRPSDRQKDRQTDTRSRLQAHRPGLALLHVGRAPSSPFPGFHRAGQLPAQWVRGALSWPGCALRPALRPPAPPSGRRLWRFIYERERERASRSPSGRAWSSAARTSFILPRARSPWAALSVLRTGPPRASPTRWASSARHAPARRVAG